MIPSVHRQYGPEPCLAAQYVLHRLVDLVKWELLDHALHAVGLRKRNRFLTVKRMSAWPVTALAHQTDGTCDRSDTYQPQTLNAFTTSDEVLTGTGPMAVWMSSLPCGCRPPSSGEMTCGFGAVTTTRAAPPSFCSSSATSWAYVSM